MWDLSAQLAAVARQFIAPHILGGVTSPADAIPDLERLMRDVLRRVFDATLGAE